MLTRLIVVVVVGAASAGRPWHVTPGLHPRQDGGVFIHHEFPGARFSLRTQGKQFGPLAIGGPPVPPPPLSSAPPRPPFTPPASLAHGLPAALPQQPAPPVSAVLPHPPPLPGNQRDGVPHPPATDVQGGGGCYTAEGFYFAGQVWYPQGCRRRKCIHFRGSFITETDSCDSEIFNTTYKCVVVVDTTANYPRCCPTYKCNPDNLGNSVKK